MKNNMDIEYYQKVGEQWDNLIHGRSVDKNVVRPEILELWETLYRKGIDPYNYKLHTVSDDELNKRISDNKLMIDIAMPFLVQLYNNISFSCSLFSIFDKDGVPLTGFYVNENSEYIEYFNENHVAPGISPDCLLPYSPEVAMCIKTKKPAWCCADENYLVKSKDWSGVAAPIFDADNQLTGVLSIFDNNKYTSSHSMAIAVSAATAISNELRIVKSNEALHALALQLSATIEAAPLGMLVVNSNGFVSNYNKRITDMLFLNDENTFSNLNGNMIGDILIDENNTFAEWIPSAIKEQEILLKTTRGFQRYYIAAKLISDDSAETSAALITLKEMEYVRKFASNLSSSHARYSFDDIVGTSAKLKQQINLGKLYANSSSTVLITGPSGTGKELFAHSIHCASDRSDGPFITINCGALPTGLVESELFGYEGGAFTGAKKNGQVGKFELANHGTLFLDEIGEMPLSVQASILRVLQTGEVTRIGGTKTSYIDVRIIAATNRNLLEAVSDKQFREDLYYRLNVLRITIPALSERKEDIRALADVFLQNYCRQLNKHNITFSSSAYDILNIYDWPGNVRELENIIERCVNIIGSDSVIDNDMLTLFLPIDYTGSPVPHQPVSHNPTFQIKHVERDLIIQVLTMNNGSITKSAQELGIGRRTLYRKCEECNIDYTQFRK